MKVLLVNGSPHPRGCTYTALKIVEEALNNEGIETEIFQVGIKPMTGCIACMKCAEDGKCVFKDKVNEFAELAKDADGFVFGSPVHYAAASGSMTSFMDRLFYSTYVSGQRLFRLKPGAAIASARRAGTTATLDQLNKYMTWGEMPVVSSQYWNMVHGRTPEDVMKDEEGVQIMRVLGKNMAWVLKCKEAGLKAGIALPEEEARSLTDFIR
ncbi:flavodoxin family protein [Pseudodesulfovibrio piezophilus]|uniref:NADPH-dependent FMN reductase n=1 Tax=Pseudodesulfovibrio piezophilus (strain DSM 21447 / JCM 15486 / C1TLV30) TaxID=1322246 RepID=M1WVE2_PSEP2|nr:flavodoxin family protein [Pseudodesulfovibrio piezophilus]CCH48363.1 NADPH-dependent FMN reductase [Pseudodesulfovibrio piezophilus C1TLV30]